MLMFEMSKFSGKKESYVIDILNNIHFLFLYIKFIFSSVVNMHFFFNCQKVMKKNLGQSLMIAKMNRKSNKYTFKIYSKRYQNTLLYFLSTFWKCCIAAWLWTTYILVSYAAN